MRWRVTMEKLEDPLYQYERWFPNASEVERWLQRMAFLSRRKAWDGRAGRFTRDGDDRICHVEVLT